MFELSRDSHQPLVDQICERVTQLVRDGQLPAGARLPSIRKLARQVGASPFTVGDAYRSEEHTAELQSQSNLVCRLLLEKKKKRHTVDERQDAQVAAMP